MAERSTETETSCWALRISPDALDPPSKPRKAKSSKGVRVMNPRRVGEKLPRPRGWTPCWAAYTAAVTKNKHRKEILKKAPAVGIHLAFARDKIAANTVSQMKASLNR